MRSDAKPDMPSIFEWLLDPLETEDLLIKPRALIEIADVHGRMIKLRGLYRACLANCHGAHQEHRKKERYCDPLHGRSSYHPQLTSKDSDWKSAEKFDNLHNVHDVTKRLFSSIYKEQIHANVHRNVHNMHLSTIYMLLERMQFGLPYRYPVKP